jgi:malonate-semialdehyde dehydrogenase (acetylating)/methylmalonate-semialdehyde dehydrogenase
MSTTIPDRADTGTEREVTAIGHWLDGAHVAGTSGRAGPVYNPALGHQTGEVALASAEEVDRAVASARAAAADWRAVSLAKRAELMFAVREIVSERRGDIARILTAEHGKVGADALGEVARGLEVIEYGCGIPTLMQGGFSEQASTGIDVYSIRQPVGVVAGITPFNFPAMVPMWMWAPALACGNCFVLKPSEKDPSASMFVAELLKEAGIPDGVFTVVNGDKVAVDRLLEHPDVGAVSFVGSTPIARYIYENGTKAGKRVQALGGAKNHMIVLPDADYDLVADAVVSSIFGSAGQRCLAGSVVVGVADAYANIRERILDRSASLRVGNGLEDGVDMGPVISARHRDRVMGYIHSGVEEGASLVMDGRDARVPGYPDGNWVGPTIFEDVHPDMAIGKEEVFGPVMGLTKADTVEDAIDLMHRSEYGNATSLFTTSGRAAREFRYHAGISMIGINIGVAAPMAFFPFGGSRGSFFGDLKAQGRDSVEFFTDKRVVITRW